MGTESRIPKSRRDCASELFSCNEKGRCLSLCGRKKEEPTFCKKANRKGQATHEVATSANPGTRSEHWCLILVMDKTAPHVFAVGMLIAMSVFAQDLGTKPGKVSHATTTQQPHRIRVDEDVQKAKLVRVVSPVYPPFLGKRTDGTVVLHVIIGKNGCVKKARAVSGPPNLRDSAVNAVHQWQYRPTLVNGMAVEVDTRVSVVFPPPAKQEPPTQGKGCNSIP